MLASWEVSERGPIPACVSLSPAAVEQMPSNAVVAATDGSCLKNPGGPSGWAWYVDDGCWAAGAIVSGTNQVAELSAMIQALRDVPMDVPLIVVSDSLYAVKSATVWMNGWKAKGWKKADGGIVSNVELMIALDQAMAARRAPFAIRWTRGHAGDHLNEHADQRCFDAARSVHGHAATDEGPGWGAGPTGVVSVPIPRVQPARGGARRGRGGPRRK